jgi:hypothetical protein
MRLWEEVLDAEGRVDKTAGGQRGPRRDAHSSQAFLGKYGEDCSPLGVITRSVLLYPFPFQIDLVLISFEACAHALRDRSLSRRSSASSMRY